MQDFNNNGHKIAKLDKIFLLDHFLSGKSEQSNSLTSSDTL